MLRVNKGRQRSPGNTAHAGFHVATSEYREKSQKLLTSLLKYIWLGLLITISCVFFGPKVKR